MIVLARKFLRRPPADRRLLVHALVLHGCVSALLRVVRFGRLSQWLRTNQAPTRCSADLQVRRFGRPKGLHHTSVKSAQAERPSATSERVETVAVERVVWAVRQATAAVPWGKTCLTEAMTLSVMLRRVGCETTLQYGVASDNGRRFAAHAWLEHNGAVVGGAMPRAYVPLRPAGSAS